MSSEKIEGMAMAYMVADSAHRKALQALDFMFEVEAEMVQKTGRDRARIEFAQAVLGVTFQLFEDAYYEAIDSVKGESDG